MKTISNTSKWLVLTGTLALSATFILPIWRIDLWAPQYPEGLSMFIWLYKLSGQVEIINGLNHYIGMAHIKEEMFPEFQILPWIIAAILIYGLLVVFFKSKKMLLTYLIVLILFGIIAMADFYKWGYEYGHNLADDAAIKVPGMSYQPPVIGYKELLNFGAYSVPASGGWIVVGLGLILIGTVVYEYKFRNT